jgi:hypothetical protein
MPLSQGHRNAVSCLDAPSDRSLLISADGGPGDTMVVGWDPESEQAVWTARDPHARGVAAMALSPDGCVLATLGAVAPGGGEQQEVRGCLGTGAGWGRRRWEACSKLLRWLQRLQNPL